MQKHFFVGDDGKIVSALAPIVPRVGQLIDFARAIGCLVVHTREGYATDMSDVSAMRSSLGYVGRENALGRFLIRGEPGHDFIDEAKPLTSETVVDKAGFNAFHCSSLQDALQASEISHLILCGVTTQCCVHSTLREAVDRGYWCLTVADCCGAYDPTVHEATHNIIASEGHLFGWIADLSDLKESQQVSQDR